MLADMTSETVKGVGVNGTVCPGRILCNADIVLSHTEDFQQSWTACDIEESSPEFENYERTTIGHHRSKRRPRR